jgi:hypothetical protein
MIGAQGVREILKMLPEKPEPFCCCLTTPQAYVMSINEFSQNCIKKYSFLNYNQICKYPSLSDRKSFWSTEIMVQITAI